MNPTTAPGFRPSRSLVVMHRAPLRLVFLVTIAAMSSCAAPVIVATAGLTAVEAGTSAYIRGVLEASERATMDEMWYSVTQTLRVLQYPVLQADRYDQTCYFAGKADNGMTITVRLERSSPVVTNVSIRVGFFGDQSLSQLILAAIREELSKLRSGSGEPKPSAGNSAG